MKKSFCLLVSACVFFSSIYLSAKEICRYDFEDTYQVSAIQNANPNARCEFELSSIVAHSGTQSLAVKPTLLGELCAVFPAPENLNCGVFTIWIFDPLFTTSPLIHSHFNLGIGICGNICGDDEKRQWFDFSFANGRERGFWFLSSADTFINTGIRRLPGWTRFDFVIEAEGPDKSVIGYINGKEAARKRASKFQLVEFNVRTFWGAGTIFVDNYSFDDEPSSFRPAAVQKIMAGDEANNVFITDGEKLNLMFLMDKRAAFSDNGIVEIELEDLRDNSIGRYKKEINWKELKDSLFSVPIPAPPTSRHYWVTAKYYEHDFDKNTLLSIPSVSEKINVQILTNKNLFSYRGKIRFAEPWDWLPASPEKTNEPPTDWKNAIKIKNLWFTNWERTLKEHKAGWYRRKFVVPKEWRGRKIILWIEQPQLSAKVFINGNTTGELNWPGGEIDLSGKVKIGEENEILIFVDGVGESALTKTVKEIIGDSKMPEQHWTPKDARGLGGEVSIYSIPLKERINSIAIDTKVSEKLLELNFNCDNLKEDKKYSIKGSISKGGKIVKSFNGEPDQIKIDWADPELWDLWSPNLYDLNAELLDQNGKTLDVIFPERFGFREIKFDKNRMLINGNQVNLFIPMPLLSLGCKGMAKWMDYNNFNYISNEHNFYYWWGAYPTSVQADDHYAFCDEAGYGSDIGISDVNLRKYLVNQLSTKKSSLLDNEIYWTTFERVVRHAIARYGNRPGLFFLNGGGGGGQLELGGMFNPMKMDGIFLKDFKNRPIMRECLAVEKKAKEIIKSIDSRRYLIAQDAGNFPDAIHITHYAGFMAIQEMIEANSYWLANGTKPYMISEQAAPMFPHDWCDHTRKAGHGTKDPIGCIAEKSAITKGDKAFIRQKVDQLELDQFEKRFARILSRNPSQRMTTEPPFGPLFAYKRDLAMPSIAWEVSYERAKEQWLNWRADGIAMLNNWSSMASTSELWKPLIGFITGPPEARTDKTHILSSGETWRRGLIILNNRRKSASVKYFWTVELDNKIIASDSRIIELPAGGKFHQPIMVPMPITEKDQIGLLKMQLKEGENIVTTDSIPFSLLPQQKTIEIKSRVALVDPENETATALRKIGLKFQQLNFNADLSNYDIIVFGRRAFSYETDILGDQIDLASLTEEGKKIIIFEQEDKILRQRFSYRTDYLSPRNAFRRAGVEHPSLKGISDQLLNYWRGHATLTDGYEIARKQPLEHEQNGARWFYLWNDEQEHPRPIKWGNRHNVATIVVMKPEKGNFRTLIDCEYGLNFAAMWEIEHEKGKILFCQMDVSGRTESEPAANRLLANLFNYLDSASQRDWNTQISYLGGEKGANFLKKYDISFKHIKKESDLTKKSLLFVGDIEPADLEKWKNTIAYHVEDGAVCFSFPKNLDNLSWLPFPVSAKEEKIDAVPVAGISSPLILGLSNADLYFKGRLSLTVLDALPQNSFSLEPNILSEISYGKGKYILCQIWPESFDIQPRFYLEESQKINHRFIQTILNNLRIQMTTPSFLKSSTRIKAKTNAEFIDLSTLNWFGLKAKQGESSTPPTDDARWKPVKVPGYVNDQYPEWKEENNALFWYRCEFNEPKLYDNATLFIGAIKDEDDTYLNGKQIGHTGRDTNANDWLLAPRYYQIPKGLLKKEKNQLLIKVICLERKSGITTGPIRLILKPETANSDENITQKLANTSPVDLSGTWFGTKSTPDEKDAPNEENKRWKPLRVPGEIEGQHSEWNNYDGYFWYLKRFEIKSIPEGAQPVLVIGAIDDEDDTYLNGEKIGHTGVDTNPKNYWMAKRMYPIPHGVLKQGSNTIIIRMNDLRGSGGILATPVQISWLHPDEIVKLRLANSLYLFPVSRADDPYCYNGW